MSNALAELKITREDIGLARSFLEMLLETRFGSRHTAVQTVGSRASSSSAAATSVSTSTSTSASAESTSALSRMGDSRLFEPRALAITLQYLGGGSGYKLSYSGWLDHTPDEDGLVESEKLAIDMGSVTLCFDETYIVCVPDFLNVAQHPDAKEDNKKPVKHAPCVLLFGTCGCRDKEGQYFYDYSKRRLYMPYYNCEDCGTSMGVDSAEDFDDYNTCGCSNSLGLHCGEYMMDANGNKPIDLVKRVFDMTGVPEHDCEYADRVRYIMFDIGF